jgi:hypothetical protein
MADMSEEEDTMGGDAPDSEPPSPVIHAAQLAAIPEVETPGRRSKRRAESVDESSMEHALRMKAARNLDFKGNKNHSQPSFLQLPNDTVLNNLDAIGISLGHDPSSIDSSLTILRQVEIDRELCKPKIDTIDNIFELEENEKVDKLILNALCSEIMEEVMDLGSAYPTD